MALSSDAFSDGMIFLQQAEVWNTPWAALTIAAVGPAESAFLGDSVSGPPMKKGIAVSSNEWHSLPSLSVLGLRSFAPIRRSLDS